MKKKTINFNIRVQFDGISKTFPLKAMTDGNLVEKYDVKCVFHKSLDHGYCLTDYASGMTMFNGNKKKDVMEWFELRFADGSLLDSYTKLSKDCVNYYGLANE